MDICILSAVFRGFALYGAEVSALDRLTALCTSCALRQIL